MKMARRTLPTVTDTENFGRELAAELCAGDLVVLEGALGVGKTALTRGIASGLGVRGRVSSPTFVIAREHRPGGDRRNKAVGLVHVDAYRLLDSIDIHSRIDALDLDAGLDDAVVVVEWGKGLVEHLADRNLHVVLTRRHGSEVRIAEWEWAPGS